MPLDSRPSYSVAQLAERWQCSEGLVRKIIGSGKLAAFRLGTLIRISAAEVDRFEGNVSPADGAVDPMDVWDDDD
ncbi:MAG TPA: helix-turn-helix domain-containing protein [Croceibacterium sp.]